MKSKILVYCILLVIIFVYASVIRNAGKWLVKQDKLVPADAIVILMGSISDRVLQATDLYARGLARKVIIVKETMGAYKILEDRGAHIISSTDQVFNIIVALGIPADSVVILPGDATSTQMEAVIIREYLINNPSVDTLLLVSASPHTRRASMIFKYALNKLKNPISVFCSPSTYTDFNAEKWWKSKEGVQTVLLEYLKLADFFLFERRELNSTDLSQSKMNL